MRATLAIALLPLVLSCRSQAERDAEAEVARIAFAVKQVRDAPNNEKVAPLGRLRAERCSTAYGCELHQVCLQAYSLHQKALETTTKVRTAMREGNARHAAAADILALAEKDLNRAREMIQACNTRERELLDELR